MLFGSYQDNSPRLPLLALLLLAGMYLLAGITGHDPWKSEDAVHIGIAHDFLSHGNWLFPRVAGEPWPHTAPLYHWVAALLGHILGGMLEFHNAARLASALFGALFFISLAGAARAFHGAIAGRTAPLLAMGTLGLLLPIHEAQPAIAGLAFAALAYWGGGLILQGKRAGALLLGTGIGLAFPAHGLVGLLMAGAVLPAPIFRRDWKSLGLALAIALPLIAAWPLLVASRTPELLAEWWQNEIAEATIMRGLPGVRHIEQLIWAAWPVLPLAVLGFWTHRHRINLLALPLLGTFITLTWYLTGSSRTLGILPLLLPLTLIATAGIEYMRRGLANAFDWFGVITFSFFSGLLWLGASAQALGWPPAIANNFRKLAPGHELHYPAIALMFAALLTVAWVLSWRLPRATWRASLHWAAGTTLMWVLAAILLLPWVNHAKSYRPVVESLRTALPPDVNCIERSNLGAGQLAALDYFSGIRTKPAASGRKCVLRLSEDDKNRKTPVGWTERWQGHRPGDRDEYLYLDQRNE